MNIRISSLKMRQIAYNQIDNLFKDINDMHGSDIIYILFLKPRLLSDQFHDFKVCGVISILRI